MWVWLKFNNSSSLNRVNGEKNKTKRWTHLGEALCCVPEEAERSGQRALQLLGHHCGGQKLRVTTVTRALTSLASSSASSSASSPASSPCLTPVLRLDELQLRPRRHLVVLADLPPHTEAQRHHVVLLAVAGPAALQVVQQRRLQAGALQGSEGRGVTISSRKAVNSQFQLQLGSGSYWRYYVGLNQH